MPATTSHEWTDRHRLSVTAAPAVLGRVRRAVRAYLHEWGLPDLADLAELGVTELLSNVCKHVEDKHCTVLLARREDAVRIEVQDRDPCIPAPRVAREWEESGRGLLLLAGMSDAWGATSLACGKAVWFTLAVKP